jgi:8-oxo-dGTP diphosphatase
MLAAPPPMVKPITIAIAVVMHDGHVLIGQRPAGVPLAGMWEFPGGKTLVGETPQAAAARECLEETGLEVAVGSECSTVAHEYPHGKVELHFFTCAPRDVGQSPAAPFRWVPIHELGSYQFPPANAELVARLRHGPGTAR